MNARKALEDKIRSAFTAAYLKEALDTFERDHAHELAQRIRKAYAGDGPDEDSWITNPFDAAYLIDPYEGEGR